MQRGLCSLTILWLLGAITNSCSGLQSFSLPASPSGAAVRSGSGEVFVAAGSRLLRLDRQLGLVEEAVVSGNLLRIALSSDESRLVGCLAGNLKTCLVFNTSNLAGGPVATVNDAAYEDENGIAIVATNHSFYLGSEGKPTGDGDDVLFLGQYQYTSEVVRTRMFQTDVTTLNRLFYGGFTTNGSLYYFVADQNPNSIRVLRACDCESGSCTSAMFNALYELEVQCFSTSSINTEICGVNFLDTFAEVQEPVVIVTQCDTGVGVLGRRNRICGYRLSEINTRMDSIYQQCRDGSSSTNIPWINVPPSCSQFSPTNECNFGDTLAIGGTAFLSGNYLVNLEGNVITAGLALEVEGVSLVYVAYSDGSSSAILVFSITMSAFAGFFNQKNTDEHIANHSVSSPVRELQYSGEDYIIVVTDETVFHLPLETCSQHTNCSECVGADRYPLCGWCTVENKCSRMSQCQNSSEQRRWVESSDQCITTSVTPQQFVLGSPTTLNVTASPSLPSGLQYNCSFSGSGDVFPIVVEAVEVVAGTEYQCNIDQPINDLGVVQTASNFSFISVEVGIEFATREGALTFYDCNAGSSCGECVQTANACGWCLYGKQCSGTSTLCIAPGGVTNSYLQLGNNTSYVEVCPILEQGPTASGDYTQPVRVARNLQLQTRNLPQPVSGYDYTCKLRGSDLPTSYISSEGVICTITQDDVKIASSQERVSLQLMWGNGAIEYSLDENSEDDIKCILYDCPQLATGCSSCLSVSLMGLQCGWCGAQTSCQVEEECTSGPLFNSTSQCAPPAISSVSPLRGPVEGGTRLTINGTDLGAVFTDIVAVTLQQGPNTNVTCQLEDYENDYIPGTRVVCETEAFSSLGGYRVSISVNRTSGIVVAQGPEFSVEQPTMSGVSPSFGPVSGGVEVAISGSDLDTGNREETRVQLNGMECSVIFVNNSLIRCVAGSLQDSSNPNTTRKGLVVVFIDNAVVNMSGVEFEYRDDPVYTTCSPQKVIPAGGITLIFKGMNLDVVGSPQFLYTDSRLMHQNMSGSCMSTNRNMTCVVPAFNSSSELTNVSYTIVVGNAPGPDLSQETLTLQTAADPFFAEDDSTYIIGSKSLLTLQGLFLKSVERSEITVTVGGQPCTERPSTADDSNTVYICVPPDNPPDGVTDAAIFVQIGENLQFEVGTLTYESGSSNNGTPLTIIIIAASGAGGVILFSAFVIFCIIGCYSRKAKEKAKQFTNLLTQMELWEVEMADECKRAFTELQTDLADLVQISDDKNLPYRDFRSFAMRFLFPSAGPDHPVLHPLDVPNVDDVIPYLNEFKTLIMDKKFLLVFVRTLEAQQGRFTLQDKCNVASLLMVAFQNDLDYATDVLKTLLSEGMRQALARSHPKLLLRRTETVAEKMLANWLCFLLFPYLLEQAGEPLFILYRAIKSQLEKGPVDVITGEARHSLSEEKLLRQKIDSKSIDGLVETDSSEVHSIKLLDCDSVTQAKEKILDVLYKNTAVSKRPQLYDVDLELCRATAGVILRDHDQTNTKDGEWTKINTLGHYRLAEMSQSAIDNPKNPVPTFRLVPRQTRPISGVNFDHVGTIIANLNSSPNMPFQEMPHVFHLIKPDQADGDEVAGPRQGKILSEVFLTRLLSTKRILQPYVDDLFKSIFAVPRGRPLPKAIKCLFDFLDLQAAELGIQDPETLHTWKTNSLPLRFWVGLIKNPDFVFDIHKSATVDACLTIIAQAYIDACSTSDIKYTKDTPSARLLYVNEVKSYKQDVHQYYSTVQSLPKLSPHEMNEYLRETAQVCARSVAPSDEIDSAHVAMTRQLYFVTESALYELFRFVCTYCEELKCALNEEGLTLMAGQIDKLKKSIKV